MDSDKGQMIFRVFTEIGIINQLISTEIERHLPDRMSSTQFGLLGHLIRRPKGETPLQLAKAFQVPKTSMTHMLAGLEQRNLIELTVNPNDARSKIARATGSAGAFLQTALEKMGPGIAQVWDEIGETPFTTALPALEEIRVALDKARD